MVLDFNPYLTASASGTKGGGLFTEVPAAVDNIVFQTRGEPLTPFEDRLADALMVAFGAGIVELADVVSALNAFGSLDDQGRPWTADGLERALKVLGERVFAPSEDAA